MMEGARDRRNQADAPGSRVFADLVRLCGVQPLLRNPLWARWCVRSLARRSRSSGAMVAGSSRNSRLTSYFRRGSCGQNRPAFSAKYMAAIGFSSTPTIAFRWGLGPYKAED